jgi:hypothetical protein
MSRETETILTPRQKAEKIIDGLTTEQLIQIEEMFEKMGERKNLPAAIAAVTQKSIDIQEEYREDIVKRFVGRLQEAKKEQQG